MTDTGYPEKLERMERDTLLPRLEPGVRDFLRRRAAIYRFTYQELRQVAQAARDLEMWGEEPLIAWWRRTESKIDGAAERSRKKRLLNELRLRLRELAAAEKLYRSRGPVEPPTRRVRLEERSSSRQIFGLCPAYSERTVCCGLHTLDAVRGCAFSCSYCTIQTFYPQIAELELDLAEKLAKIELDPTRRYHIGTGQASDSLIWGNRGGQLDALLAFAAAHPNVLLELKTKSDHIAPLRERDVPRSVVCSWTLNSDTVIAHEERGTAPLHLRLRAARTASDARIPVAFHFHPMLFYRGWEHDYRRVVAQVLEMFTPQEVSFVSMGSVTMIKPVVREIRKRGGRTKILQMEMVADPHGKLTYPDAIKIRLFQTLFSSFSAWHESVFFYLCMETDSIWRQVLGHSYLTNDDFERAFLDCCLPDGGARSVGVET